MLPLGLYIPLIVVNCIILGRAEAYAMKNGPILSAFDGIGMGLGFTVARHSSVPSVSFGCRYYLWYPDYAGFLSADPQSSSWRRVHSSYWLA